MIDQLTVFITNEKGRLTAMCRTLGDAGIQMSSLTVADTSDNGIARIICHDPEKAVVALDEAGFRASLTKVVGVKIPDTPGALAKVFAALEDAGINVEYSYCFSAAGCAVDALKAPVEAKAVLEQAGFELISQADLA